MTLTKKLLAILTSVLLFCTMIPLGALSVASSEEPQSELTSNNSWYDYAVTAFAGGSGTQSDPYLIATAQQLAHIADVCKNTNYYYSLVSNIDLGDYNWKPIPSFSGHFDGNGYQIQNMQIQECTAHIGFFENTNNAVVQDVIFTNPRISIATTSAEIQCIGIVTGHCTGYISDVSVIDGAISFNSSTASAVNALHVGGIAGSQGVGIIQNCSFSGSISVSDSGDSCEAGGIVGYMTYNSGAVVRFCHSTGIVDVRSAKENSTCGGIVGYVCGGDSADSCGIVSNCASYANVSAYGFSIARAGGVAGFVSIGAIIETSYASGTVFTSATSTDHNVYASSAGGLVGHLEGAIYYCATNNTSVDSRCSSGAVSSVLIKQFTSSSGRLIGMRKNGSFTACYTSAATTVSYQTYKKGILGKVTRDIVNGVTDANGNLVDAITEDLLFNSLNWGKFTDLNHVAENPYHVWKMDSKPYLYTQDRCSMSILYTITGSLWYADVFYFMSGTTKTVNSPTLEGFEPDYASITGDPAQATAYYTVSYDNNTLGLLYKISDGEVAITGYTADLPHDLVIPPTIEGYPVTAIAYSAFQFCDMLQSVSIPDSVTSIGNFAFSYCQSLTSVTIPDSVTSIGSYAFYSCTSLTSVTIPNSVISIGSYAFYSCTSLTSVTIPNSVTSIGDGPFAGCSSLTAIAVDSPNYCSVDGVLLNYDKSLLIQYPAGKAASSYIIPDGVTSIGSYAFYDCFELTDITIPDSVTSIGSGAFYNCSSLTSITIPDGVTSIESNAFNYCTSLTSITIPDSVTSIGYDAFYRCFSLTSITIPDSVTSIGDSAFWYCQSLTSITIPDGVTSISNSAFAYCQSLTSVTIPDSVISIESGAFVSCQSLTSITIPNSVTAIGNYAFHDCQSLTDVYYGGSEEDKANIAIGSNNDPLLNATWHYNYADCEHVYFSDCDIVCEKCHEITREASHNVLHVEAKAPTCTANGNIEYWYCDVCGYAWLDERCMLNTNLKSVILPGGEHLYDSDTDTDCNRCGETREIILASGTTGDCTWTLYSDGHLIISGEGEMGNYNSYTVTPPWMNLTVTKVTIEPGVTNVGQYAFYGCQSLASVTIPDGVSYIGQYAFYGCAALTTVTIPGVSGIGTNAFGYCSQLTSVTLPDSVAEIDPYAFNYCSNLSDIYYGGSRADRANIAISTYNDPLLNATWHYAEADCEHVYFSDCDIVCEKCHEITREASHNVLHVEAKAPTCTENGNIEYWYCDVCGYAWLDERCWLNTNLLSVILPGGEHVYDDDSDPDCNRCGETRLVIVASGTTGDCTWVLYDNGHLVISGEGEMGNYSASSPAPWKNLTVKQVTLENGVTNVGEYAFYECKALTAAMLANSVTTIGNRAFSYCSALSTLAISTNVTTVSTHAFSYCTTLTAITLPDKVTSVGNNAFASCSALAKVTLPDSLTAIGNYAFYQCKALASVVVPDNVVTVGSYAFGLCPALTSLTLGKSVCRIDSSLCYGSTALTSIVIPDGVIHIGAYAFQKCTSLTSVTIPKSVTNVERNAFDQCSKLTDVHYGGSETDRTNITIATKNDPLLNATWHYAKCAHVYDDDSDPDCNECGAVRWVTCPDSGITIGGDLPAGTTVTIGAVEFDPPNPADDEELVLVYAISLTADGESVALGGTVWVTLPAPENVVLYTHLQVVYISKSGEVTLCETTVNPNGTITFLIDRFD